MEGFMLQLLLAWLCMHSARPWYFPWSPFTSYSLLPAHLCITNCDWWSGRAIYTQLYMSQMIEKKQERKRGRIDAGMGDYCAYTSSSSRSWAKVCTKGEYSERWICLLTRFPGCQGKGSMTDRSTYGRVEDNWVRTGAHERNQYGERVLLGRKTTWVD